MNNFDLINILRITDIFEKNWKKIEKKQTFLFLLIFSINIAETKKLFKQSSLLFAREPSLSQGASGQPPAARGVSRPVYFLI